VNTCQLIANSGTLNCIAFLIDGPTKVEQFPNPTKPNRDAENAGVEFCTTTFVTVPFSFSTTTFSVIPTQHRLRNDLYCVEWGVKLYSLTHPIHG